MGLQITSSSTLLWAVIQSSSSASTLAPATWRCAPRWTGKRWVSLSLLLNHCPEHVLICFIKDLVVSDEHFNHYCVYLTAVIERRCRDVYIFIIPLTQPPLAFQITHYSLTVQAADEGDPPLSSAVQVTVTVSDVNDNPPMFSQINHSLVLQVKTHSKKSTFLPPCPVSQWFRFLQSDSFRRHRNITPNDLEEIQMSSTDNQANIWWLKWLFHGRNERIC